MLKQRLITGLSGLIIAILIIWFLPMPWFGLLMGLIVLWSAWEWTQLLGLKTQTKRFAYLVLMLVMMVLAYSFVPIKVVLLVALVTWLWCAIAVVSAVTGHSSCGLQWFGSKVCLGILALIPCWLVTIYLREYSVRGHFLLFFALMLVWSVDVGAYFSGRLWGKRLLAPKVSPKKTWEGFWGGLVLSLIVALIVGLCFHFTAAKLVYLLLCVFVVGLFAVVGDLLESLLKRQANIKDSGSLLPGHGGILDRVDSVAAALPIFAIAVMLLS